MTVHTLELWYSVRNGGDGSAYPHFMESLELAEWDQEHQGDYGWGESCTGKVVLQSASPIEVVSDYHTRFTYMHEEVAEEDLEEYRAEFFPEGLAEVVG